MKLNIFNSWKSLGKMYGKELEFQTSRVPDKDLFVTYIRDKKSGNTVTRAYGKTREASLEATIRQLKTHDGDTVWNAIETGEPILAAAMPNKTPEKKVEWRDDLPHLSIRPSSPVSCLERWGKSSPQGSETHCRGKG